ncbi:response regulator transcription factor [Pyxidicoccus parkwayensis]|uniref:Response regulator transcription factor n=1 Tax=Pyxidicoccus parkwayensis TaxID=2813578 RepID=A0ABX7P738_9BACT|nr:response regulator transcription factor [Pyxidicoccus parkwaysis]QSQ26256.1 response regulator transcription factor [Pyxidicoccus parkwaysis]
MDRTRIFVVEDQPQLLKNLVKVLGTFPELEVVGTSQEGEAAVEAILEVRPQLVLLDLELPGINGIQVTQRVKRRAPEVEILILTSFDDEQKVYEAIQAGASGYLVKRVGPEKIRSGIQEVMEGGTVLEPIIARRFWNYFQSVQAKPAPDKKPENPWSLTPTEFEVLRYVAKGLSNAEVGQVMTLERRTVRTHLSHIYRKMGVNSHVEAVVMALRAGVVDL